MRTAKQICSLSLDDARRLVAWQQVQLAEHERGWAGSMGPEAMGEADEGLSVARCIHRDICKFYTNGGRKYKHMLTTQRRRRQKRGE